MGQLHYMFYTLLEVGERGGVVLQGTVRAVDVENWRVTVDVSARRPEPRPNVLYPNDHPGGAVPGQQHTFTLHSGIEWTNPNKHPVDYRLAGGLHPTDIEVGSEILIVGHMTVEALHADDETLRLVELAFDEKQRIAYRRQTEPRQLIADLLNPHLRDLAWRALGERHVVDVATMMELFSAEDVRVVFSPLFDRLDERDRSAWILDGARHFEDATLPGDARYARFCEKALGQFSDWHASRAQEPWAAAGRLFARLRPSVEQERSLIYSADFYIRRLVERGEVTLPLGAFQEVMLAYLRLSDSYTTRDHREWLARLACFQGDELAAFLAALAEELGALPRTTRDGARELELDLFDLICDAMAHAPAARLAPVLVRVARYLEAEPAPPAGFSMSFGDDEPSASHDERLVQAAVALAGVAPDSRGAIIAALEPAVRNEQMREAGIEAWKTLRAG